MVWVVGVVLMLFVLERMYFPRLVLVRFAERARRRWCRSYMLIILVRTVIDGLRMQSCKPSSWWSFWVYTNYAPNKCCMLSFKSQTKLRYDITICIQLLVGLFNRSVSNSCHFPAKWAGNSVDFENIVLIDMIPLTQAKITAEGVRPNCQEAQ